MSDGSSRILALIDELEEQITESRPLIGGRTLVNSEVIEEIIKDMRLSLPKDIEQAQWICNEKERILSEANEDYNKIIYNAKKQAEYLLDNDAIKREAEKRADAIIQQAEGNSQHLKNLTFHYLDDLMYRTQVSIGDLVKEYIEPMNERLMEELNGVNQTINENRKEMVSKIENESFVPENDDRA